MTDFDILFHSLNRIGCKFSWCNTLIGKTISIATVNKEIDFEFDQNGSFL